MKIFLKDNKGETLSFDHNQIANISFGNPFALGVVVTVVMGNDSLALVPTDEVELEQIFRVLAFVHE